MAQEEVDGEGLESTQAVLKEIRALRQHLAGTGIGTDSGNARRLEMLEDGIQQQNVVLNQINLQTMCIPDLKKTQDEHAERINTLESDKDKMLGAKAVVGVLVMGGAGAIGAWFKSFIDTHFR